MKTIKVVKLSKKYQTNVQNIENERKKVEEVIQNTFEKFINEENYNTLDYVNQCLIDEYIYISNDIILSEGKYIRYLDLKNVNKIKLRIGGFVLFDNGYSVTIKVQNGNIRLSKKNKIFFSKMTDTDRIRDAVKEYL